jgi:hypothetical protein
MRPVWGLTEPAFSVRDAKFKWENNLWPTDLSRSFLTS